MRKIPLFFVKRSLLFFVSALAVVASLFRSAPQEATSSHFSLSTIDDGINNGIDRVYADVAPSLPGSDPFDSGGTGDSGGAGGDS